MYELTAILTEHTRPLRAPARHRGERGGQQQQQNKKPISS